MEKYNIVNDMIIEYSFLNEELPQDLNEETKNIIKNILQVDLNTNENDYIKLLNQKRIKENKLFGIKTLKLKNQN